MIESAAKDADAVPVLITWDRFGARDEQGVHRPRKPADLICYQVAVALNGTACLILVLVETADTTDALVRSLYVVCAERRRGHPDCGNVHRRYGASLLSLDYRRACLRHAASLPPRDDKYHLQPDDLSAIRGADQRSAFAATPTWTPEVPTRPPEVRAAADWAIACARKPANWRQREVTARRVLIEAIAAVLGPPTSVGPAAQRNAASRG